MSNRESAFPVGGKSPCAKIVRVKSAEAKLFAKKFRLNGLNQPVEDCFSGKKHHFAMTPKKMEMERTFPDNYINRR
jgi:hypothetical protein